jgi:dTDP-4-amino-4,6-dideoxygalactose transaminase
MTTVDGGALVCKSSADRERGRLLRWYGIDRKCKRTDLRCEADIAEYGYKFHMNDVTAVIGLEQLKYVGKTIEKHRANAKRYDEAFKNLEAVRPLKYKSDRSSVYWLYTIRVKNSPKFMEYMEKEGITVSQVHARNDSHTIFKDSKVELPGVDEFTSEQVSIPVGWWLTDEDLAKIIDAIVEYDHCCQPELQEIRNIPRKREKTLTRQTHI